MLLLSKVKDFFLYVKKEIELQKYLPLYKVVEIFENEENEYTVAIQVINKSFYFYAKPEELLADDLIVDQFSPRDIRTLTYLGYLQINSPQYQILAKKLAADNDNLIFALKKRGNNNIIIKTAAQILQENDIIKNMCPDDAKIIGYTVATEEVRSEKQEKEAILKKILENKK